MCSVCPGLWLALNLSCSCRRLSRAPGQFLVGQLERGCRYHEAPSGGFVSTPGFPSISVGSRAMDSPVCMSRCWGWDRGAPCSCSPTLASFPWPSALGVPKTEQPVVVSWDLGVHSHPVFWSTSCGQYSLGAEPDGAVATCVWEPLTWPVLEEGSALGSDGRRVEWGCSCGWDSSGQLTLKLHHLGISGIFSCHQDWCKSTGKRNSGLLGVDSRVGPDACGECGVCGEVDRMFPASQHSAARIVVFLGGVGWGM